MLNTLHPRLVRRIWMDSTIRVFVNDFLAEKRVKDPPKQKEYHFLKKNIRNRE